MGIVIERNGKTLKDAGERGAANIIVGLLTIDGVADAIGAAKHPDGITGVTPTVAQRHDHDADGEGSDGARHALSVSVRGVRNQYGRRAGEQFTGLGITQDEAGSASYVIEVVTYLAGGELRRSAVIRLGDANDAGSVEAVYRVITEVVRASLTNTPVKLDR